jgi:hypothetical protein
VDGHFEGQNTEKEAILIILFGPIVQGHPERSRFSGEAMDLRLIDPNLIDPGA